MDSAPPTVRKRVSRVRGELLADARLPIQNIRRAAPARSGRTEGTKVLPKEDTAALDSCRRTSCVLSDVCFQIIVLIYSKVMWTSQYVREHRL